MRNARDAGLPWLAEIPPHWEVSRLKFETTHIVDCLHATPPYSPEGEFPAIRTADVEPGRLLLHQAHRLTTENYLRWTERLVPIEGDILYTREGERFGIAACVPPRVRLCISQRMMLFRIRPDRDSSYFMWQLNARHVYEQAAEDQVGAAAPHVNVEKIQNFRLLVPPLDEQRGIVDRIARETSRMDALVAAKQRLLDLLAEKRKAIIATAITRGLDPKVKLRDSGVPWLGVIPAHWELWKVGHMAKVGNGSTPERDNVAYWSEGAFPWLNSSVVNQEEVTSSDQFVTDAALRECHLPRLRPGTVLVAITGQGKTRGQAVVLSIEATINQHMAFVAPDPALVDVWFLRWSFYRAYDYLRSISDDAGGTKGALTCEDVAGLRIPVPPPDEQRTIVAHIARETAKLDAVRAATERTIALLKERRSALIAAAVTGQIDVGVAA